jgi:hypothetical protein
VGQPKVLSGSIVKLGYPKKKKKKKRCINCLVYILHLSLIFNCQDTDLASH